MRILGKKLWILRTFGKKRGNLRKCLSYNLQSMFQGILMLTSTMTMVYVSSEYRSHLKCSWLYCMLQFLSMFVAVSLWPLFDNLSLKLGNLHVNQRICCHFCSHEQQCSFQFLLFPGFCLPPVLMSVLEGLSCAHKSKEVFP